MKRKSGARPGRLRWLFFVALLAAPIVGIERVYAQPSAGSTQSSTVEVQGTVVELDQEDLVLDLGASSGVTESQIVEIWRPLKVKHPVTGKILTDRFKIGQVQIGQVRPALSMAKPSGTLLRSAAVGDLVIFRRTAPKPASPKSAEPKNPSTQAPSGGAPSVLGPKTPYDIDTAPAPVPEDIDAARVTKMFDSLRGQSIATRIMSYEQFLRQHPDSRFAQVLYEESMALRQLMTRTSEPTEKPQKPQGPPPPSLVGAVDVIQALEGQPVRIAVELSGAVKGAVLQYRRKGDTHYTPLPMRSTGKGYYSAEIPADRVRGADLEYFIDATGEKGIVSLAGQAEAPSKVEVVNKEPVKLPLIGKGSVGVLTDVADYNRMRGNDYAWQIEGTFGMRFKDIGIRAVRMGFGVFRGVSGTVAELDELGLPGREVGLTYGYLEGEFGMHKYFSLIARAAVGLLDEGVSGGAQLLGRIGNDRGTNLLLGGEVLGGIGLRSIIELQLNTFERFPIVLRTEVTNQPAGMSPSPSQIRPGVAEGQSEVAGRGIVQVGFRPVPELTLAVRGSFQGRNINHAGPGVGGFVGYTW